MKSYVVKTVVALACEWLLIALWLRHVYGAWTVFAVLMWLATLADLLALRLFGRDGIPQPRWKRVLLACSDILVVLVCALNGHPVYVVLVAVQIIAELILFAPPIEVTFEIIPPPPPNSRWSR